MTSLSPSKKMAKLKLIDVNEYLTCNLCAGYLVDATTIVECVHSFCRSCILNELEKQKKTRDVNFEPKCPECGVALSAPFNENLKMDQTLQDLVYKLVPRLYRAELQKRKDFYLTCLNETKESEPSTSSPTSSKSSPSNDTNKLQRLFDKHLVELSSLIFSSDDSISLSLEFSSRKEFSPPANSVRRSRRGKETLKVSETDELLDELPFSKRYFRCCAAVKIAHLKKLLATKCDVLPCDVEILHSDELLEDQLTLMDIAYIYTWRRKAPMQLFFNINRDARRTKPPKLEPTVIKMEPKTPDTLSTASSSSKCKLLDLDLVKPTPPKLVSTKPVTPMRAPRITPVESKMELVVPVLSATVTSKEISPPPILKAQMARKMESKPDSDSPFLKPTAPAIKAWHGSHKSSDHHSSDKKHQRRPSSSFVAALPKSNVTVTHSVIQSKPPVLKPSAPAPWNPMYGRSGGPVISASYPDRESMPTLTPLVSQSMESKHISSNTTPMARSRPPPLQPIGGKMTFGSPSSSSTPLLHRHHGNNAPPGVHATNGKGLSVPRLVGPHFGAAVGGHDRSKTHNHPASTVALRPTVPKSKPLLKRPLPPPQVRNEMGFPFSNPNKNPVDILSVHADVIAKNNPMTAGSSTPPMRFPRHSVTNDATNAIRKPSFKPVGASYESNPASVSKPSSLFTSTTLFNRWGNAGDQDSKLPIGTSSHPQTVLSPVEQRSKSALETARFSFSGNFSDEEDGTGDPDSQIRSFLTGGCHGGGKISHRSVDDINVSSHRKRKQITPVKRRAESTFQVSPIRSDVPGTSGDRIVPPLKILRLEASDSS